MRRKALMLGAAALAAAGGVALWRQWPDEGLDSPCLDGLPARLAEHPLVRAAWAGIDPRQVWDMHAHLAGPDAAERLAAHAGPIGSLQRRFFLNAACVDARADSVERAYLDRLRRLRAEFHPASRVLLLALDRVHDEQGRALDAHTPIHVADAHVAAVAKAHPGEFEWVASVHPYRSDALDALESAARAGARAVKWIPSSMGIDPAAPRCDRYYDALARLDLPLISHAGLQRAVAGAGQQAFGNPLRLRRALDHGVRVIVAHCATMGEDRDLDRGEHGPMVESFVLFARLMDDARYTRQLYGDLAAVLQLRRAGPALAQLLQRQEWHARLLNGSDYPLPGLMPLFSTEHLAAQGWLAHEAVPVLREIRRYNPLLYDFVAKRHLRAGGRGFDQAVFETRRIFERRTVAGA